LTNKLSFEVSFSGGNPLVNASFSSMDNALRLDANLQGTFFTLASVRLLSADVLFGLNWGGSYFGSMCSRWRFPNYKMDM